MNHLRHGRHYCRSITGVTPCSATPFGIRGRRASEWRRVARSAANTRLLRHAAVALNIGARMRSRRDGRGLMSQRRARGNLVEGCAYSQCSFPVLVLRSHVSHMTTCRSMRCPSTADSRNAKSTRMNGSICSPKRPHAFTYPHNARWIQPPISPLHLPLLPHHGRGLRYYPRYPSTSHLSLCTTGKMLQPLPARGGLLGGMRAWMPRSKNCSTHTSTRTLTIQILNSPYKSCIISSDPSVTVHKVHL